MDRLPLSSAGLTQPLTFIAMGDGSPDPLPETADLTSRMVHGDEDAYHEFYRRYGHRLLRYLVVLNHGQVEVAKDVLQQTLLRVVRNIRRFDSDAILWSWLTVLARSAAIDHGRKRQSYLKLLSNLGSANPKPLPPPGRDLGEELSRHLETEVALLPEEDRRIVESKYHTRLSVSAIARQEVSTEKAIESRLTRIRQRLRDAVMKRLSRETHA